MDKSDESKYYLDQLAELVDGKITGIAKTEDGFFGIVVTMPDGKRRTMILLSDDEGNDHGSFYLS